MDPTTDDEVEVETVEESTVSATLERTATLRYEAETARQALDAKTDGVCLFPGS